MNKSTVREIICFWEPENDTDNAEFMTGFTDGSRDYLNSTQPKVFSEHDSFPYKVGYCRGYVEEKLSRLKSRLRRGISVQSNAYEVFIAEQEYLQILDATEFLLQ